MNKELKNKIDTDVKTSRKITFAHLVTTIWMI